MLGNPSPLQCQPGVYAWYFREIPPHVTTSNCHIAGTKILLYVGISPKEPTKNGTAPSKQKLLDRVRYHYRGNTEGSNFRLTLGCLLADRLGIQLRRVGSGTLMTFAEGESTRKERNVKSSLLRGRSFARFQTSRCSRPTVAVSLQVACPWRSMDSA